MIMSYKLCWCRLSVKWPDNWPTNFRRPTDQPLPIDVADFADGRPTFAQTDDPRLRIRLPAPASPACATPRTNEPWLAETQTDDLRPTEFYSYINRRGSTHQSCVWKKQCQCPTTDAHFVYINIAIMPQFSKWLWKKCCPSTSHSDILIQKTCECETFTFSGSIFIKTSWPIGISIGNWNQCRFRFQSGVRDGSPRKWEDCQGGIHRRWHNHALPSCIDEENKGKGQSHGNHLRNLRDFPFIQ